MGDNNNKYNIFTFMAGNQCYGLPVRNIDRVLRAAEITSVPTVSDMLLGMLNISGNILPVVNSYKLFNHSESKNIVYSDDYFILVNFQSIMFVLVVDRIGEIFSVSDEDMVKVIGGNMVTINNQIIFIPNIDKDKISQIREYSPSTAFQVKKVII